MAGRWSGRGCEFARQKRDTSIGVPRVYLAPLCERLPETAAYAHTRDAQPFQYRRQLNVTMGDVQRIPGIYLCVSDEPDSPFQRWLKANRRNPGQNPVLPKWVAVPNRRRLPDLSLPVIGHHSPRL